MRASAARGGGLALCLFAALTSGCATLAPDECTRFEQLRKTSDYDTNYTYLETESRYAAQSFARHSLRGGAAARWYTLRVNRASVRPCEHLYLVKDLYLVRSGQALAFEEQREFYTAQGQLIATKREDVTKQLSRSGFYTASVPLPIPRSAPAGTYRVVSRLLATPPRGRTQTLATATAQFRVR